MFDASFEALFDVLFGLAPFGRPLIASCRTDAGEPAVTGHTASRGRAVEDQGDDADRANREGLKPPLVLGVGHPGSDHGSTGYRARFIVLGGGGG
ncbi:hypothetical protein ACVIHI_001883 [Bradyrhizobium sp. USDA 4524]|uniref:hypothetical protein n=1 Tax=unclassified Bradyrhizobium TaxID=2631580 RepID=UPI00209E8FD3|nr:MULTISPECIES: hypothetical protein [unclassified Bradyrhizobium]MCP1845196.1 hypothetical protein [Bradyrhizobium sp. USDA 4538]MCP1905761.1 hypothetical protein [Bradyrhizobium sp. USDA 4537]MCP1988583.1 hypothetical protein [Bradyrhizobium sp. USDA 4539]